MGGGRGHGSAPLTDGEDEDGGAKGQQSGSGKCHLVGAKPDAQETAAVGREGRAYLMAEEDPAKQNRAGRWWSMVITPFRL
jgi:hypothetical protein